jgi:adenylate cyclase
MSLIASSDLIGRAPGGRKLIAVVFADMVDYSRLLGLDDIGTLQRLRTLRRLLIDPAISDHGGRLVSTAGDSLFIEFDSIDGAVRCALAIQRQIPDYDGDAPFDRTIRFRVGINIADVIADGTNLHGDGVNVAARLQAQCPPGAICVSRAVRDHMLGQPDLTFEALGPLSLKNIVHPVEAFVLRVHRPVTTVREAAERSLVPSTLHMPSLPERPSIAVLAFTNMSGDPDQEYFSDGMADDIITELSRSRSLFVIARNSSFTYKGRALNVKQVARQLGVRYVVQGSLRRGGSGLRITAQLVDAESGHHLWAERYDCADTKLFEVQDCIANAVTAAIHPAIAEAELRRALRKPPESLDAWQLYQRGLWHIGKYNAADNEHAIDFFQRAIEQDETFVPPYLRLAFAYRESGQVYATRALDEAIRLAGIWTLKAAEIDPRDADVQIALGSVAHLSGRRDEAWECAATALAISPNSARAITLRGALLIFNGQPAEGRSDLLSAVRLDPLHPGAGAGRWSMITVSYYFEGEYQAAAETARQTIARYPTARFPNSAMPHRWLAASLGQLGRTAEAREALSTAIAVAPKAFDLFVRNRVPWHRPEDYEHMLEGLRKAGWQE